MFVWYTLIKIMVSKLTVGQPRDNSVYCIQYYILEQPRIIKTIII